MKPVKFNRMNCIFAEDQPEYLPLPCHKTSDGLVTSCWKLTPTERIKLLFTGRIFLQMLTFNSPLQPVKLDVSEKCIKD